MERREDGKVSGGQVKGKVRAAGQDRNRDRDEDRVEGTRRRFLSLMMLKRLLLLAIFFASAAVARTASHLVGRQAGRPHSTAHTRRLLFLLLTIFSFSLGILDSILGLSCVFRSSFSAFSCLALRRLLAVVVLIMVRGLVLAQLMLMRWPCTILHWDLV